MKRKALSAASILSSTFETLRDGISILDLELNIVKVKNDYALSSEKVMVTELRQA